MFGCLLAAEIQAMDKVLNSSVHPVTAILGGAKVSSKLAVLENLLDKVDNLIICGGMSFTFIKARGGHIGQSLCEDELMDTALDILRQASKKAFRYICPQT